MEFWENGDLKNYIDKRKKTKNPIDENFIWNVLTQMILALKAWHENKDEVHNEKRPIIHRDIKPGNIFIDRHNQFKLGDFGLSKELSEASHCGKTNLGTPYYMSPEQVGGIEYNHKVDIWALGCILHEMAWLEVPFRAENYIRLAEIISKSKKGPIPDRYSKELSKIIDLMTQKNPEKRPNASQLLHHPKIADCLVNINLKKRSILKTEKEEFFKRQTSLFERELKLKQKEREVEKLKIYYQKKIKELEEIKQNYENDILKNNRNIQNPDYSRNSKHNDIRGLNKTVDQLQDFSVMNSSQEKNIDTSLKVERMSHDFKNGSDNIENINISNRNLLSSTSSYNKNNYTIRSSYDSKNLSGSNNFDDSQNELSRSKVKFQRPFREMYGKNIKQINLYSEDNSNGSIDIKKSRWGNAYLGNDSRDKIQSLMTRDTAQTIQRTVNNALGQHLALKEKSFDGKQPSNIRGLPPSGQKQIQRASLDINKKADVSSLAQKDGQKTMTKNYSTIFLQNSKNDEGSRNRLTSRKSIPIVYRTNSVENLHAPSRGMRNANQTLQSNVISNTRMNLKISKDLIMKKAESDGSRKPPMMNNLIKGGIDLNIFKSMKKLTPGVKNSFSKKKYTTSASTSNLKTVGNMTSKRDNQNWQITSQKHHLNTGTSITTPKGFMGTTFDMNNIGSRRQSIENSKNLAHRGQIMGGMQRNGSVTNRTISRPFYDDPLMGVKNIQNPWLNNFMKRRDSHNY